MKKAVYIIDIILAAASLMLAGGAMDGGNVILGVIFAAVGCVLALTASRLHEDEWDKNEPKQ